MNPSDMFCPHEACPLRGQRGQHNITVFSLKQRRFRCSCCGHTFSQSKGTPFYRLRTPEAPVTVALTLLGHG
jgi:transposase-like protein